MSETDVSIGDIVFKISKGLIEAMRVETVVKNLDGLVLRGSVAKLEVCENTSGEACFLFTRKEVAGQQAYQFLSLQEVMCEEAQYE